MPVVAAERNDVAFMVTLVGPAESLADQQGHVIEELMRRSDESFTDDELRAAFEYQKQLVELSHEGAEWSVFKPLTETARSKRWARFVDLPESIANPEARLLSPSAGL